MQKFKYPWRVAILLILVWQAITSHSFAQSAESTVLMVLPRDEQNIEIAFRDYLKKRNLPIKIDTIRFSGNSQDGAALVEKIRKAAPNLIYTWGTGTTLAVAGPHNTPRPGDFIRDIPIVFTEVTDPIGSSLLQQLSPPGRNVTGVSHLAPLVVQINAIRTYRPFKRLGYITNPKESNTKLVYEALVKLGQTMKFEVVQEVLPVDAQGNPEVAALPTAINRIAASKVDFLYIGPSTFLAFTHRDLVTQTALDAKLPTFCATESIVRKSKCLFGLFSNGNNVGRFAAYKAAQILADKQAVETIPAETLQRFSLLINMPTAKNIDLYPPLNLLNVAEVIQ